MPSTEIQYPQAGIHPAQPPVRCLDLDLHANGLTNSIRLSGCTFADVLSLCARSVWKQYAYIAEGKALAKPAVQAIKDQPIQALELTLYEDGSINHVSLSGCTVEQALEFCRFIVKFDALADNHWLDDEEADD